jgi:hypothetical protein
VRELLNRCLWQSLAREPKARTVGLSATEARNAADLLGQIEDEVPAFYDVDGVFVAGDGEKNTYKFRDDSNRRFTGPVGPNARDIVKTVTLRKQRYNAIIQ